MKKFIPIILFLSIVLLASFLRLYLLGSVPAGLTNDEANTGYDAYSLLKTGRDQWGTFLPIVFPGFGNYPPPLYRYVVVPFIAIFGLNTFALRLPSALFGIGSVIALFFLGKKLFNSTFGLIAAFLLAVSPWAIGLNRISLEPNLSLFLLTCGLLVYFLSEKRLFMHLLGTLLILLTIPTYAAYSLFAPIVMGMLLIYSYFKKQITKIHMGVVIVVSLFFLFLFHGNSATARFSQVGVFGNITSIGFINTLNDERGACQTYLPHFICKIENNKIILFSNILFKNYLSHFSPEFLFISGTSTQQSILPERGLDYLLNSVFLLFGILALLKQTSKGKLILGLLFLSAIPDSLTSSGNFSRGFIMLPFLQICEAAGVYYLYQKIQNIKPQFIKLVTIWGFIVISFSGIIIFSITYFTYFRDYYSRFSQYGYESLMKYLYKNHQQYQKIYITTHLNDAKQYIYYLFYNQYDPRTYQRKSNVSYHTTSDGWISIDRIDNIYFVPSITADMIQEKNLLISHPSDFHKCKGIFYVKDRIGYEMFEAIPSDVISVENKTLICQDK